MITLNGSTEAFDAALSAERRADMAVELAEMRRGGCCWICEARPGLDGRTPHEGSCWRPAIRKGMLVAVECD